MQTDLSTALLATSDGARANDILRTCVHCGFCNATCPTYQLTGNELDGPRGRIYLIKELLEAEETPGDKVSGDTFDRAQTHLDRCLTCRACETTCPSGVAYGELLEIGRGRVEHNRSLVQRGMRVWLKSVLPNRKWFAGFSFLGRLFRWGLPAYLRESLPAKALRQPTWKDTSHPRRVLVLNGCVQSSMTPATNEALAAVLDARGVACMTLPDEGCCGSLPLHLGDEEDAHRRIALLVEQIEPLLDSVEAVISTASGCGVTVKDYGRLLREHPLAAAAARVSAKTADAGQWLAGELAIPAPNEAGKSDVASEAELLPLRAPAKSAAYAHVQRIAWHAPCTLQHGQRLGGEIAGMLKSAGYELVPVQDPHLCCGSAGTYSVLQPEMSAALRERKVAALTRHSPEVVATANVGCQQHLGVTAGIPVVHWLELIA